MLCKMFNFWITALHLLFDGEQESVIYPINYPWDLITAAPTNSLNILPQEILACIISGQSDLKF